MHQLLLLAAGPLRKDPSVQCLACTAMPQKPNSLSQAFPNGHFDQNWGLFCSPELEFSGSCLIPPTAHSPGCEWAHLLQGVALQNVGGGLTLREILGLLFRGQLEETLDGALYA